MSNPCQSVKDIQSTLAEIGASFGASTTRNAGMKSSGYVNTKPKYHQLIWELNKVKRVAFCTTLIEDQKTFNNIIITDECTVQLHNNKITVYWWKDWLAPQFPKPKHPLKVHVWAGISCCGATPILVFDGIMDAWFYVNNILQDQFLPFIWNTYGDDHRFMQDNDPKHT